MSAFVNGFFITPVLRQARRLSERTRERLGGDSRAQQQQQQQPPIPEHDESDSCDNMADRSIGSTVAVTAEGATPVEDASSVAQPTAAGSSQQSPTEAAAEPIGMPRPTPPASARRPGALPENDGHQHLRKRLQEIQLMSESPEHKAQLMHKVMMEKYLRTQGKSHAEYQLHSHLSASDRDSCHESLLSSSAPDSAFGKSWSGSLKVGSALESLKLWPSEAEGGLEQLQRSLSRSDLEPTYSNIDPDAPPTDAPHDDEPVDPEAFRLGCKHYLRNVKLQCSTCARWYTCRFCHDEAEDHKLVRKETRNMLCMLCGCAQRASEACVKCAEPAAKYYCNVCKLWDDHPDKPVYHCADCGICRKGVGLGKDYFHCKKCCVCIPVRIADSHRCIERSTDCDCPICGDYLFTSPLPVVFMNCGHSIHHKCYSQYTQTSYKCPICNKSLRNMESQFRNLDVAIAHQPMPAEYRGSTAVVLCNDCSSRSSVPYHWLGLKCGMCRSYNTVQMQVFGRAAGRQAAEQAIDEEQLVTALENHRLTVDTGVAAAGAPDSSAPPAASLPIPPPDSATSATSPTPRRISFSRSRGNSDMNLRSILGSAGLISNAISSSGLASPLSEDDSDVDIVGFWGPHSDSAQGYVPSFGMLMGGRPDEEEEEEESSDEEEDDEARRRGDDEGEEDDDDLFLFGHR